jgi:hypothetical protein
MSKDYSERAILRFLDYLSNKHLMKPATVRARKAAVKKMLDVLDPSEKEDLRSINIDQVYDQFINKHGMGFTPESQKVYKSRFNSAYNDFIAYTENPNDFKPSVTKRESTTQTSRKPNQPGKKPKIKTGIEHPVAPSRPGTVVFPVPIRPELTVELRNIPADLTSAEAEKISAVIHALAQK